MDRKYSWKRTEEIEIDLLDLLNRLCGQWKRFVACGLAAAIIFGGYGWFKNRSDLDLAESDESGGTMLTEAEAQTVTDALQLKKEIAGLENYLDHSILMQADPYHRNRQIMLYCIDRAQRNELPEITESYLNFILNGGAADALRKADSRWKMDKSYLAEAIVAYQKVYSSPYLITAGSQEDTDQTGESLFYVEVTGRDAGEAAQMAQDLQDVLDKYSAEVRERTGRHRKTLISSQANVTADSSLLSQQKDRIALLSANQTNLTAMTDEFSREQMMAYQNESVLESEDWQEEQGETVTDDNASPVSDNSGFNMKYILLGLMGGIFAYCCIFSGWYILSNKVKSIDEMKGLYTFPIYGGILLEGKNRKYVRADRQDAYGCAEVQVRNRIRLSCQIHEVERLCAVFDFPLDAAEKECLEKMAGKLKCNGIALAVAEGVSTDAAVWDSLMENRNVLMVCRIGTTTRRMIDDSMNFYKENGITVIGAIVF